MSIYVYAIVRRPVPRAVLARRRGARLRAVDAGPIAAVVADRDAPPPRDVAAIRSHDRTVRRIGRLAGAVLPVTFGMVFDGDRALRGLLQGRSLEFQRALRLVDRREQMTVRLLAPRRSPRAVAGRADGRAKSGTAYLRGRADDHARSQLAPELEPLHRALGSIVSARRIARHEAGPFLLTAFHLIPRGTARAYRRLLDSQAATLGLRLMASGPWPPYAFVPQVTG